MEDNLPLARVARLRARSLRRAPWVEAARSVGVGPGRLLGRHVLPSLAGPVALLAVAFLGEHPSAREWIGLALVTGGVMLIALKRG